MWAVLAARHQDPHLTCRHGCVSEERGGPAIRPCLSRIRCPTTLLWVLTRAASMEAFSITSSSSRCSSDGIQPLLKTSPTNSPPCNSDSEPTPVQHKGYK